MIGRKVTGFSGSLQQGVLTYFMRGTGVALREVYLEKGTFKLRPKSGVGVSSTKKEKEGTPNSRALQQEELTGFQE